MIAGGQALITSFAMPTGWYVLAQTPMRMFDLHRDPPVLLNIGDEVRFQPIGSDEFLRLNQKAEEV
jgi:allophanate hydrolase subunit 1